MTLYFAKTVFATAVLLLRGHDVECDAVTVKFSKKMEEGQNAIPTEGPDEEEKEENYDFEGNDTDEEVWENYDEQEWHGAHEGGEAGDPNQAQNANGNFHAYVGDNELAEVELPNDNE
jgi:hypothetical protein